MSEIGVVETCDESCEDLECATNIDANVSGTELQIAEHEIRDGGSAQLTDHEHATEGKVYESFFVLRRLIEQAEDVEAATLSEEVENYDGTGSYEAEEGSNTSTEDSAHQNKDNIAQATIQEIERRKEVNAKRFRRSLERLEVEARHAKILGLDDEVDMSRKAYEKDLKEFGWELAACPFGDYISHPVSVDDDGKKLYGPSQRMTKNEKRLYDQINRENGIKCESECDSCRRKRMMKEKHEEIAQLEAAKIKKLRYQGVEDLQDVLMAQARALFASNQERIKKRAGPGRLLTLEEQLERQRTEREEAERRLNPVMEHPAEDGTNADTV